MKIICENGFYKFFPVNVMELEVYQKLSGYKLYFNGMFWTFKDLLDFPKFSFMGQNVGLNIAIKNFSGSQEEVLRENALTYNLKLGIITPKAVVLNYIDYDKGSFMSSRHLPQAFGFDKELTKVSGFEAFVDVGLMVYAIERFFYESF